MLPFGLKKGNFEKELTKKKKETAIKAKISYIKNSIKKSNISTSKIKKKK
jgi:hypothetical protein